MKKYALSCLLLLVCAPAAEAQAIRTWVSGLGSDANPCSRTAPCRTFAAAFNNTVNDGYISVIDAGGYGPLTITHSVTIEGQGSIAGVLQASAGGSAITINGRGIKVTLRNLSLEGADGAGYGVRIISAGRVLIENCNITNFNIGIYVPAAANVTIVDTTVKGSANEGIYIANGAAVLSRVISTGNGATGVLATGSSEVTVRDTVSSYNESGFGAALNANAQMDIENSTASNNQFGLLVTSGATIRLSQSTIVHSSTNAMFNDGLSNLLTFENNRFANNAAPGVFTGTIMVR